MTGVLNFLFFSVNEIFVVAVYLWENVFGLSNQSDQIKWMEIFPAVLFYDVDRPSHFIVINDTTIFIQIFFLCFPRVLFDSLDILQSLRVLI